MLLSASADGSTIAWDADSGAQLRRFAAHNASIWGAAFGADDHTVYSAAGDGTMMAWDVSDRSDLLSAGPAGAPAAGRLGAALAAPNGRTVARIQDDQVAAFSPDGALLAAPNEDGSVGLLDPDQSSWVGEQSRTELGRRRRVRPGRQPVRVRTAGPSQALGRLHRCLPGQRPPP